MGPLSNFLALEMVRGDGTNSPGQFTFSVIVIFSHHGTMKVEEDGIAFFTGTGVSNFP
jgi:hypothetical protein